MFREILVAGFLMLVQVLQAVPMLPAEIEDEERGCTYECIPC